MFKKHLIYSLYPSRTFFQDAYKKMKKRKEAKIITSPGFTNL